MGDVDIDHSLAVLGEMASRVAAWIESVYDITTPRERIWVGRLVSCSLPLFWTSLVLHAILRATPPPSGATPRVWIVAALEFLGVVACLLGLVLLHLLSVVLSRLHRVPPQQCR